MNAGAIYLKTEKGDMEINNRSFGLPAGMRHVLILIDGKSTVQKIMEKGAGLPDIGASLAQLDKQGFIRVMEHSIAHIKEQLINTAWETLGNNAEKIIRKIKESPDTPEGLSQTITSCKKLVKLVIDETKADELEKKCTEILKRCQM